MSDARIAAQRYIAALVAGAPAASFVEIRCRASAGMRQTFYGVSDTAAAASDIVRLAGRSDIYIGVLPRTRRGGGRRDVVHRGRVLWVDCDTPDSASALLRWTPPPSMTVLSGTGRNRHAYWLLAEPVSVDVIECANRRLAAELAADVASSDVARILRPPGSLNHKHDPPAQVRIERCDPDVRHSVADVVGPLPESAGGPAPSSCQWRTMPDDPVLALDPAAYIERLAGVQVPRSRKIHCPFHPDRTPSLHVYPDAEQGWFCFGCRRGGSVYDFAAESWWAAPAFRSTASERVVNVVGAR